MNVRTQPSFCDMLPLVRLGNPTAKDPKFYKTTNMTFHTKHHRMLAQPSPGIASEDAKRVHKKQGYN